jgi:tetratricopeptide (TPR) repeat protein
VLHDGLALDPKSESLLNILGYAEAFNGNQTAALQANDQYVALRPNDPNPLDTRGDIYFYFGQDDQALANYRKVLELKPDFNEHDEYVKLFGVYADQGKLALADAAVQEYARKTNSLGRLYLPVFEARLKQSHGDIDGALDSYKTAIAGLKAAGQERAAGTVLRISAGVAAIAGKTSAFLSYARQQKLHGEELAGIAFLERVAGDQASSDRDYQQFATAHPEILEPGMTQERAFAELLFSLAHGDAQGMLAAACRISDATADIAWFARGRAHMIQKDYVTAEAELRRATLANRIQFNPNFTRRQIPLIGFLAHYYLGQVYETAGKRDQAINEYQTFLSHFENSRATLPEIAAAKDALKRLMS